VTSTSRSSIIGILIAAVSFACLCYNGMFYRTGAQFYDTCWQKVHANGKEPNSPQQAANWSVCEDTADAALYGAHFIFAGIPDNLVTPQLKAVGAACPSNAYDRPIGGSWILAVKLMQDRGGPTLGDHFSSARYSIVRVFKTRWPNCGAIAAANGFPPVVKKEGDWVFETPCIPCKPEEAAIAKQQEETEKAQARWAGMSEAERNKEVDNSLDAAIKEAEKKK
jgi:hypothetical protein